MQDFLIVTGFFGLIALGFWIAHEQHQEENKNADKIVCPHCHTAGHIKVFNVQRKKGISGGKATGALMTGGVSMAAPASPASRTSATCGVATAACNGTSGEDQLQQHAATVGPTAGGRGAGADGLRDCVRSWGQRPESREHERERHRGAD